MNLTKKNILIAVAINVALMAVSYNLGFCINNALICSAIWIPIMAVLYFKQPNANRTAE